jgi:drug/metabolite transporter (DMT)-like permease
MMLARSRPSVAALALPIVMALSFSLYVVMTRQLHTEPVMTNLLYTALGVFIALTPFIPSQWVMPSPRDAFLLAGVGAVGLVALYALDRAASHSAVTTSIPMLYAYLPTMALVMWALYGVRPTRRVTGGAILIVAMLLLHWNANRRAATRPLAAMA